MNNPRIIPIVMDSGALSDAAVRLHETAHDHSHAATDASTPIPARPPVFLKVGDREIDEAEIAREMQHHRADNPHISRVDAARALVVRELLLQEIERLGHRQRRATRFRNIGRGLYPFADRTGSTHARTG